MTVAAVLERLSELGVRLEVAGDKLRVTPASVVPPDLLADLRQYKPEIMAHLRRPKLFDAPPQWHAEEISKAVAREGVCVFWSEVVGEVIAFIEDDSFKSRVPCGIMAYTRRELKELFDEGKPELSPANLRLIHEAKKAGGHVVSHEPKG
ncbi:MAG: hypothetical protein FJ012_08825 [Chloroflexi bacterium]|nr:hypothetical protein [Chloroflexota bacterium]